MNTWIFSLVEDFSERKNGVILTKKVESLVELKLDPRFRVIGQYLSQYDSILEVNFRIDSQHLVNLTQIFTNYSESGVESQFRQ